MTIAHIATGGDHSMGAIAYALPMPAGEEEALQVLSEDLKSGSGRYGDRCERNRVAREATFLQRNEHGDHLIIYREFDDSAATPSRSDGALESSLKDRVSSIHGLDPVAVPQSGVELLVRQRPARPGNLHAAALPLLPDKVARLHEWALELNGIHAAEFEESLRRLGYGLTLFVQHTADVDLLISVVEGDEPETALGQLANSQHPFDQWHFHQIVELTGINFSAQPPSPNKLLWAWDTSVA